LNDNNQYEKELNDILKNNLNKDDFNYKVKMFYYSISEFISRHFTLITKQSTFIGNNIVKYPTATFNLEFYKDIIKNNITNQEYDLVYTKYILNNIKYYAIINVVPINSKINNFGLYDNIVSAGVYISKILEYKEQCSISGININIDKTCYIFIGNLMTNMYPLNIIKNRNLI